MIKTITILCGAYQLSTGKAIPYFYIY